MTLAVAIVSLVATTLWIVVVVRRQRRLEKRWRKTFGDWKL